MSISYKAGLWVYRALKRRNMPCFMLVHIPTDLPVTVLVTSVYHHLKCNQWCLDSV